MPSQPSRLKQPAALGGVGCVHRTQTHRHTDTHTIIHTLSHYHTITHHHTHILTHTHTITHTHTHYHTLSHTITHILLHYHKNTHAYAIIQRPVHQGPTLTYLMEGWLSQLGVHAVEIHSLFVCETRSENRTYVSAPAQHALVLTFLWSFWTSARAPVRAAVQSACGEVPG